VGGCPAGTDVSFPAAPIHYDELELRGTFHHSPAEVDEALRGRRPPLSASEPAGGRRSPGR
jgi:hypothetical protein